MGLAAEAAEANDCLARLRFKTRDLPGARDAYAKAASARFAELNPPYAKAFEELGRQIGTAESEPDEGLPEAPGAP